MKLKIAVVQFEISQYNPISNLEKMERFVQDASAQGANVIVFPEYSVTGPIAGEKDFVDFKGRYSLIFQSWALKYNIDIVPGSLIEGNEQGWFNTTYYIDRRGNIKGRYQKIRLWHPEKRYISTGNRTVVFQTKYGKAGLLICWDLMFADLFRAMLDKGVRIIYCVSYWPFGDGGIIGMKYNPNSEIELVNALSIARAFENGIIFVYSNPAGTYNIKGHTGTLIGRSQITAPFIGPIRRLDHFQEEMFIQEVDTDIVRDAERIYRIRADIKSSSLIG